MDQNTHNVSSDSEAMLSFFVVQSSQFEFTTHPTYQQGKHSQSMDRKDN